MKDPKLLIPVRCTTRKFYLHQSPTGRNDWHVRFTPPAIDGVRRVVFRSTGTKEIAAAKRIAARIIESFWIDAGRGAERLKLRNDNATIGELIAKYKATRAQRPGTIRSNVRSLRMIVKTVHGGDPDTKSTSVLTANLIREFEKRQLERAEKRATPATRASCDPAGPYLYRELCPAGAINRRAAEDEILRRFEAAGSDRISWRELSRRRNDHCLARST